MTKHRSSSSKAQADAARDYSFDQSYVQGGASRRKRSPALKPKPASVGESSMVSNGSASFNVSDARLADANLVRFGGLKKKYHAHPKAHEKEMKHKSAVNKRITSDTRILSKRHSTGNHKKQYTFATYGRKILTDIKSCKGLAMSHGSGVTVDGWVKNIIDECAKRSTKFLPANRKTIDVKAVAGALSSMMPGKLFGHVATAINSGLSKYAAYKSRETESHEKKTSSSYKAGILMSVSRVDKRFRAELPGSTSESKSKATGKKIVTNAHNVGKQAMVALAAAIDFLVGELLETAGRHVCKDKRSTVNTHYLQRVFNNQADDLSRIAGMPQYGDVAPRVMGTRKERGAKRSSRRSSGKSKSPKRKAKK